MTQPPDPTSHREVSTSTGAAWSDDIASERKQALWARLRAWWAEQDHDERAEPRGPFVGERLTGAEVFWLAVCALAEPAAADDAQALTAAAARLCSALHDGRARAGLLLPGLPLQGAYLRRAQLGEAQLSEAQLSGANLCGADLIGANLSLANLREADLRWADLRWADLIGADLRGARLRRAKLIGALLAGTDLSGTDLSMAQLNGVHLTGMNLRGVDLRGACLRGAQLTGTTFAGATLAAADLSHAVCLKTDFSAADLTGCTVTGIAVWDVDLTHTVQADLRITGARKPALTVDDLQVAQFLSRMLQAANSRQVNDALPTNLVLLLGRFTPERKVVVDALRAEVRHRGYVPVLVDVAPASSRGLTEAVSTLAHLARFIIADLTDAKSLPAALEHIVPTLPPVAIQPLLHTAETEDALFEHVKRYPWVLATYRYTTIEHLLADLSVHVIDPAEQRANELLPPR